MATDQGEEIPARGEIDELTPGKAEDVGKALHLLPDSCGVAQGVGTPVHLPLQARYGFKTDDRLPLRLGPEVPQSGPQDADRSGIARGHQLLKDPLAGNPGIFLQQLPDLLLKHIEFAPPPLDPCGQHRVMTLVATPLLRTQGPTNRVAADGEMTGQGPDRPAFFAQQHQLLRQLLPVTDELDHVRLPGARRAGVAWPDRVR